jgi:hypothetical protein
MKKNILLNFLLFFSSAIIAQDQTWLLGCGSKTASNNDYEHTVIDFKKNNYTFPPAIIEWDVKKYSQFTTRTSTNNTVIADTLGNLKLSFNGWEIRALPYKDTSVLASIGKFYFYYDVLERTQLPYNLNQSISQSSILLPHQSKPNHYMLFYLDSSTTTKDWVLYYSLINRTEPYENKAKSQILIAKQEIVRGNFEKGGMMVCRHGNGKDWWLLIGQRDNLNQLQYNRFIIGDSIKYAGTQKTNFQSIIERKFYRSMLVRYAPNGQYLVRAQTGNKERNLYEILPFDRCTGEVDVSKAIQFQFNEPSENFNGGVEFSPNSKLLYIATGKKLLQYDFETKTDIIIAEKEVTTGTCASGECTIHGIKLGPDNRIYMISSQKASLGVIFEPNKKGTSCGFYEDTLKLPSRMCAAEGPIQPNYRLGKTVCFMATNDAISQKELLLVPNPGAEQFTIQSKESERFDVEVFNAVGQLIFKTKNVNTVDASAWNTGFYIVNLSQNGVFLAGRKWVKM